MKWEEVRQRYPHQWVLVEAVQAHSEAGKRIVDQLSVINTFADSSTALNQYSQLHRQWPEREYFVLHTDRELLDIKELHRLGIRNDQTTRFSRSNFGSRAGSHARDSGGMGAASAWNLDLLRLTHRR
jgi:hypothetical protein